MLEKLAIYSVVFGAQPHPLSLSLLLSNLHLAHLESESGPGRWRSKANFDSTASIFRCRPSVELAEVRSVSCSCFPVLRTGKMAAVAEKTIGADDPFVGRQPEELAEAEYQSDVRKLVDLLSTLNPAAKEFFPSKYAAADSAGCQKPDDRLSADAPSFEASGGFCNGSSRMDSSSDGSSNSQPNYRVISFNFVFRSSIYF